MGYIDPELIRQAKQMDLLTYLQRCEPYELVRLSSLVYSTKTHDSLKISHGKWMWWSRGIGGRSALDYLVKVREMDFVEAVERLLSCAPMSYSVEEPPKKEPDRQLKLPKKNDNNRRVISYLMQRGIDREIINDCISKGILYESTGYHNAVFVGLDESKTARFGAVRGTAKGVFRLDCEGSDKRFSFRLVGDEGDTVHLFEAAIDVLSFATLIKEGGGDWKSFQLLSLSGIYAPQKEDEPMKTPDALKHFLEQNKRIKRIVLHLDNDRAGRAASKGIMKNLSDQYEVIDDPPPKGKDVNDFLCIRKGICRETNAKSLQR